MRPPMHVFCADRWWATAVHGHTRVAASTKLPAGFEVILHGVTISGASHSNALPEIKHQGDFFIIARRIVVQSQAPAAC